LKIKFLLLVFVLFFCSKVFAINLTLYFGYENLFWKEINDSGRTILTEKGFAASPGIRFTILKRKVSFKGSFDLFLAPSMNYNGETMEGIPVTTKNLWIGIRWNSGISYEFLRWKYLSFSFSLDLGGMNWIRKLNSTTLSNGTFVSGYTEIWESLYLDTSLKAFWWYKKVKFSIGIYGIYPCYTINKADLPDVEAVLLRLKGKISPGLEVGIKVYNFELMWFYREYSFKKSNTVVVQGYSGDYYGIWQPGSLFRIQGIKVSYSF